MQRPQVPSSDHGFTLIEVLISLAITAVITSLLYGTLRTTIQSAHAIDKQADAYRIARMVFHQLTKDFGMIYQKKIPAGSLTEFDPPFGLLLFKAGDDVRLAEGDIYPSDTVHFTTLSFQPVSKGIPLSGQSEISYSLSEDVLIRDARFRERRIKNDLGESILGFNLRFFDGKKKDWVDEWIPEATNELPKAIEIELIIQVSHASSPTVRFFETPIEKRQFKTIVEIPVSETV